MAPMIYIFFQFFWVKNIHIRPKIINLAFLSLISWPIGRVRYVCRQKCLTDNGFRHGLRTPNEGINQRNLKFWAEVADKICFGRTYKFGIGI